MHGAALGQLQRACPARLLLARAPAACPPTHLPGSAKNAPQSYTSSPVDPQARLFYNPAFNSDDVSRMSESRSIIRCAEYVGEAPPGERVDGAPACLPCVVIGRLRLKAA